MSAKALLVVDVQNDFCPGGALPVPEGDKVVPPLNQYLALFHKNHWPIFASRDSHPPVTKHFKDYGGIWPVHCVQNTPGAMFRPDLEIPSDAVILSKGMDPEDKDAYSDIDSIDPKGNRFSDLLKNLGVQEVFVGGLATDYCVRWSVLDLLKHGFRVNLLTDAIRGVNIKPDDSKKAIKEMISGGTKTLTYSDLITR